MHFFTVNLVDQLVGISLAAKFFPTGLWKSEAGPKWLVGTNDG